ncbi:LysR family transcriptional regulator [Caenimonas sp. SL110]|uniref:LysR family transcriptional regulator n=1 Tax=Caenimonas sp. SL110 TaxID=1450524 RepID=UPI00065306FD|nr:LysR family transcriptional regulator [Caenimonas sp. SL110]
MTLRLRQMEVFRAVMLTGSINGASRMLFISQPAVSRIISHMEQGLGYQLFNRTKGKLVPTPEGEALFTEVDDFYQHAMRVSDFAADLAHGPAGTLNISSSPCLSYRIVPRAIARFVDRYPRIRVNYHTTLMHMMAAEVLSNKVDLVVSVLPLEHPHLKVETFRRGRMVCVMPEGHELAAAETITFSDLSSVPLITHNPSIQFGKLIESAFAQAGFTPAPRIHVLQTEIACSLVRAGAGLAIVDEYTAAGGPWSGIVIRPLAHEIPLAPSIARTVFDRHGTHAQKFIEILTALD